MLINMPRFRMTSRIIHVLPSPLPRPRSPGARTLQGKRHLVYEVYLCRLPSSAPKRFTVKP